jgi:adenosylcobinamide-phosphate synthase
VSSDKRRTLALALLLDAALDDPPNRWHPVAWMGSLILWAERNAPRGEPHLELLYGAGLALGGSRLVAQLANALQKLLDSLPASLDWLLSALALKTVFTRRGLASAAQRVEGVLETGDLPEARRLLSWHLVSRDTSQLSSSQVAAATIESVAENLSDGVVAPLFYYLLGGLPLAFAYRFINTADSILGYHDPRHEWLGKISARLDDLANWLPARISAGLITLAAALGGEDGLRAWATTRRDARLTQSPNAGYPMSAMAGALGLELEKSGHYRLGAGGRQAAAADIHRATRLLSLATLLGAALLFILPSRRRKRDRRGG